jgi:hypothetical protein
MLKIEICDKRSQTMVNSNKSLQFCQLLDEAALELYICSP